MINFNYFDFLCSRNYFTLLHLFLKKIYMKGWDRGWREVQEGGEDMCIHTKADSHCCTAGAV